MSKKQRILSLILAVEAILLVFGYNYWQEQNRLYDVLSGVEETLGATPSVSFSPSFPSSFETISGVPSVSVVSTGEISSVDLRNADTREAIAKAGVLEVVTLDINGKARKLNLVVQMAPASDPQRNLMSWIVEAAAELGAVELASGNIMLSDSELARVFPEGSYITFVPLTDLDKEEVEDSLPEYLSYANKYYGGSTQKVQDLITSGFTKRQTSLILVLDVLEFLND